MNVIPVKRDEFDDAVDDDDEDKEMNKGNVEEELDVERRNEQIWRMVKRRTMSPHQMLRRRRMPRIWHILLSQQAEEGGECGRQQG